MERIEILRKKVCELYESDNPDRAEWADWLYRNHVFLVAHESKRLAVRFGAKAELAEAAGMLHDIADAEMSRSDPRHEERSREIAIQSLQGSDFRSEEIETIVNDAIKFHGCHDGRLPQTLEGKVMATADAVIHLSSDFYSHGKEAMTGTRTKEEIREWAFPKIERDFLQKIQFDEIREKIRADYERARALFE